MANDLISDALGGALHGWAELQRQDGQDLDPWARRNLDRLAGLERAWLDQSDGDTLLHADIRPDNMLRRADGTVAVVDWAYLHQGAAWVETAMLLPHFIRAGHTPEQAEAVAAGIDAWSAAPAKAVTSYAIALGGYWANGSRKPAPPGLPYLRGYQREMASIARQ